MAAQRGGRPDGELVRAVIGLYARGPPVCGDSLLSALGGLHGLARASLPQLSRLGLAPSQVAAVLATVEVGRRLARADVPNREPLFPSPAPLARYLALRYGTSHQEMMGAVFLASRGEVLREECFFRGTLNHCVVEPRPILQRAVECRAVGLILFHTHPSGDPQPSRQDLGFTERMRLAGEVMGVRLRDHLIVAPGGAWTSLREPAGW